MHGTVRSCLPYSTEYLIRCLSARERTRAPTPTASQKLSHKDPFRCSAESGGLRVRINDDDVYSERKWLTIMMFTTTLAVKNVIATSSSIQTLAILQVTL